MIKKTVYAAGSDRYEARRRPRLAKRWSSATVAAVVLVTLGALWFLGGCKATPIVSAEGIAAEIVPAEGEGTSYGIPLSPANTQTFIDYYETAALTSDQQAIVDEALGSLKAPCCDDNSMATCCCPCNLAKSVWGLSGNLVVERGYGVEEVREAASQWLHFIHGDYFVREEMAARGIDPGDWGNSHGDSCYVGNCELPFTEGGCGGMAQLVQ